jgi:hypothetical protein
MSNRNSLPDKEIQASELVKVRDAAVGKTNEVRMNEQWRNCRNIEDLVTENKKNER